MLNHKIGLLGLIIMILVLIIACEEPQKVSNANQKTLYLLRHAKSSHAEPSLNDYDRPLKKKGMRDAAMIGELLREKKIKIDLILSSSARRTVETVEFLTKEMAYKGDIKEEKGVYRCVPSTLRKIISQLDDKYQHIMIVGHNPAMTEVTNQLGDTSIKKMPTCALSSIVFNTDSWAEVAKQKGDLQFYTYPKLLSSQQKKSFKEEDEKEEEKDDEIIEMQVIEEVSVSED